MAADMELARSAAIRFLNRLPRAEDITIVDFDTEVRIATYTQTDFTRLVARLRGRKPDGWTALWDAVGVYLGGSQDQAGQKVLIVFTDGGDTRSSLTYVDLLNALKASDVSVYAIGFLEHQPSSVRTQQRLQLAQLADLTGGQAECGNDEGGRPHGTREDSAIAVRGGSPCRRRPEATRPRARQVKQAYT